MATTPNESFMEALELRLVKGLALADEVSPDIGPESSVKRG